MEQGEISRTETRRHEGKTGVSEFMLVFRIKYTDSCLIFMFFKSFMVKLAVLCVFASLCDKWFYWFCKGLSRMWKERSQETGVRRQNGNR